MLLNLLNLNSSKINHNRYKILLYSGLFVCISSGIYEAWFSLNEYEKFEKNKSFSKKVEKSCVGLTYGFFVNGPINCVIFPMLVPGTIISGTHSFYSKYIEKEK
jgi:hypothetical protein